MEDCGNNTIGDRFYYWLWKAHEDEDQLKDGTREPEVNTSVFLILGRLNLQADVQIKSRPEKT